MTGFRKNKEFFWDNVKKDALNECWEWLGVRNEKGYGIFRKQKKAIPAHRFAYEEFKEEIPAGLVIDHLCRNPSCVNPDHLEVVTPRVNFIRGIGPPGINFRKTHCKRGHEFTKENTYLRKRRSGNLNRGCMMCLYGHLKVIDIERPSVIHTDMTMPKTGNEVFALRKKLKLSRYEFAVALDISPSGVEKIETVNKDKPVSEYFEMKWEKNHKNLK